MRRFLCGLIIFAGAGLVFASCSVTRHVPDGKYLLMKNEIEVENDSELKKSEQITESELDSYIRQRPASRFLGTNLLMWLYNQADPDKTNGWNNLKRRLGSAPVYLDTVQTQRGVDNMQIFLEGKGFFDAKVTYSIDTTYSSKKAKVTYEAREGLPYRIGKIDYDFQDELLRPLVMSDSAQTLIHTGDIFNASVLDDERVRITEFLKNNGYYNFTINNISYRADTTVGDNMYNLTMVVRQYVEGYDESGRQVLDDNSIYRIRNIYIHPDYDPTVAASDPDYNDRLDTVEYRGLHIVYDTRLTIRPEILRRTINIYPNYLYSEEGVKRTYDNIMRLGYYKSASILFTEQPSDSTSADNLVTFIGGDDTGQALSIKEDYLDCNILCTPALRQSFTVELEGTTTSDYFGIAAKLGYQNRNLLKGVELFDISVRGGYEFMQNKSKRNSYELGAAVSFSFPRFITPFNVDRYNRTFNPRTRTEISYNLQRRPYYHRTIFGANLGYSWSNNKNSSFILRPVDISIVKLRDIDAQFLAEIQNPYLRESYRDKFIAGLSGAYIFSNQLKNIESNSLSLRVNFETNGNLIYGLSHVFNSKRPDKIFGMEYAQYFRIDANVVQRFIFGEKTSLVYRFYTGWGRAYGSSSEIPFERLFYAGGANSMRGWLARTLGPGSSPKVTGDYFPSQLANFKLEANLEMRFPVWGVLQGATFFDVGNIWFLGQGGQSSSDTFRLNKFLSQLGLNAGLGARLDFSFFVLRVDWGIKLHSPNEIAGQRWIQNFKFKNTTLNFGVGYPF